MNEMTKRASTARKMGMGLLQEWPLIVNLATTQVFLVYGQGLLSNLAHPVWFTLILAWLLLIILSSIFAVVRHAESLAEKLGEPLGTLVLTLSVTSIEVMIIIATMLTGKGSPTLARDAMFAVIMIALNGTVGLTLPDRRVKVQGAGLQSAGRHFIPGGHTSARRDRTGSAQLHCLRTRPDFFHGPGSFPDHRIGGLVWCLSYDPERTTSHLLSNCASHGGSEGCETEVADHP